MKWWIRKQISESIQIKGVGNSLVEDDINHLLPSRVIPSVPELIQ